MSYDLSGRPYYDRGDESIKKGYTKVAFNPNVPLQQSELTEVQTLLEHHLKRTGDAIFSDGDLISGLDFDIKETPEGDLLVTFQPGLIYLEGLVRNYDGGSVTLSGIGDETINAYVESTIVTNVDDATLLDPTIGAPSESSKGADRVKEVVRLVANQPDYTKVFDFEEGRLLVTKDRPGADKLMDLLAERTYDESGSYRVEGYELYVDTTQESATEVSLVASAGKAYVRGYKVEKPSSTRIPIAKSMDSREVIDEQQLYQDSDGLGGTLQKVKLNNRPVESVRSVTGTVTQIKALVTRDPSSRIDNIGQTGVTSIVEFHVGGVPTVYTQGVDYQLINGSQIQWIVGGKSPTSGSTYQVTYLYTYAFIKGDEYEVVESKELDVNGLPAFYIDFSKKSGRKPVDKTNISITYSYYLARKDLIMLDRFGKFTVLEGQPSTIDEVFAPSSQDTLTLPIGTITVFPNSLYATTNSETVTNIPFEKLQKLVARVQTLEYNMSSMAMDLSAQQGFNPLLLRGIFSDGFNTIEKLDEGLEGLEEDGKVLRYVGFSFEDAEITLPFKEEKQNDIGINQSTSESGWQAMSWGRVVTSPYKRVTLIDQPIATNIMNVNPYMVFDERTGSLKLNPSNDNWIEKENITVNNTKTKTYRVNRWWRHNGDTRGNADSEFIKNNKDSISWDKGQTSLTGGTLAYDKANPRTGVITSNGGTNTMETAIEFMRSRTVKITAEGLLPFADNLYLIFNGIKVSLKPSGTTTAGTQKDTVKADAKGKVTASFVVPSGQRCGSVDVEITNAGTGALKPSSATAIYTAQGTKRTTEKIVLTTKITVKLYDPLAQSFQITEDRIVSGVGLYFQSKDSTIPLMVQIRGMSDGGQPNSTIYAEKVLQPADIKTSTKGTVVTDVFFDDPVMAKAGDTFAVVLLSDSPEYNVFIATMGETYVTDPKKKLYTQANIGVLFSSSNAQTWTAHQTSDMKFKVYGVEFREGEATAVFDTVDNIGMDKLLITASYLTPQNTGILWEIRYVLDTDATEVTIDSKSWIPAKNFTDIDPGAVARKAQIRAKFYANKYMSPIFALDDFSLMSLLTEQNAIYVGKTVSGSKYNTISINYMQMIPEGEKGSTSITPKIYTGESLNGRYKWLTEADVTALGGGNSWKTTYSQPDINGFVSVNHTIKLTTAKEAFKIRLDFSAKSPVARPRVKLLRCTMTEQ